MPYPVDDRDRQVLPRWRDSRTTASLGELDSTASGPPRVGPGRTGLQLKTEQWLKNRSLAFAGDLLATALLDDVRLEPVADAAAFVLDSADAPKSLRVVAQRILDPAGTDNSVLETYGAPALAASRWQRIHSLRTHLKEAPRDGLAWGDLALEYTSLGLHRQALHAIDVAMQLAPHNRFLLRSASRLLVHVDSSDIALSLLRTSPATPHDPWLLAAEIAISAWSEESPRFAKVASYALGRGDLAPLHTAELASALATMQADAGAHRKSRDLFRRSLIAPTENAVAQAEWASHRLGFGDFDPAALRVPGSFEARAAASLRSGDFLSATSFVWQWLRDQAFSRHSAISGSYIAGVALDDHHQALRFTEVGLAANPGDWLLLNNRAFSLACLGQLDTAEMTLPRPRLPSVDMWEEATTEATLGMLKFRRGFLEEGRQLYERSRARFERLGIPKGAALAAVYLANEEARIGSPFVGEALAAAFEACGRARQAPEVWAALNRVKARVAASATALPE
jgi:tetratricopeptide (TPR) repeat protein